MNETLLSLDAVQASYGSSQVLFDVTLRIAAGEIVTLIGRNGMGKSTTVHCIAGLHEARNGSLRIEGQETAAMAAHRIARLGVGLVPEGRQIFGTLTVRENLVATASQRYGNQWNLRSVYALFPRLAERQASAGSNLSGGEQQMLAIGRALMTNPKLLVLDEATEGLAPNIRGEIWRCLVQLKKAGLAMLLIDKNIEPLLRLGDRHYVLEKGRVVWAGGSEDMRNNTQLIDTYVGVSAGKQ